MPCSCISRISLWTLSQVYKGLSTHFSFSVETDLHSPSFPPLPSMDANGTFPPTSNVPSSLLLSMTSTTSSSDVAILGVGVVLAGLYLFRDQLFAAKPATRSLPISGGAKTQNGSGNPRDFIAKMKDGVRPLYSSTHILLTTSSSEKAHCHLLRLPDRYCRRVRHPSR